MRVNIRASHFKLVCIATLSLVVANCGGSSTPASPSLPPTPTVTSVQVAGLPSSLSPGETAQVTARASLSDGSTQVVTSQATWRSENTDVATVSAGGLVMAVRAGAAEIRATYQAASGGASVEVKQATRLFSICGDVKESASATPVAGVLVEIRNGTNVGKNTTTDGAGEYCLPSLQADSFTVRASRTLYDTLDRTITLVGDATLDFGLLVTTPTITIGLNGAVSPSPIFIAVGQRVTFVNGHSRGHDMESNPHPAHTDCRELAGVGFLAPGQSRSSAIFNRAVTCGYHDHDDSANPRLNGAVVVR